MLNISTHLSVSWPQPAGQAVAPVTAVTAVQPVQQGGRNSPSGPDAGRHTPSAGLDDKSQRSGSPARPASASPLPGELPSDSAVAGQRDAAAEREAEQAAAQAAAQKAADEARHQQLQDVLSNVWKASAAVVDRVLGRDAAMGATPEAGPAGETLSTRSPLAPAPVAGAAGSGQAPIDPLPWPPMPEGSAGGDPTAAAPGRAGQDVVAYDEHGNSSWAPLEAGALISRRV